MNSMTLDNVKHDGRINLFSYLVAGTRIFFSFYCATLFILGEAEDLDRFGRLNPHSSSSKFSSNIRTCCMQSKDIF